jgi:two-component system, chemotaxis family, protein-glutamate methylesterase/glutaminase
MNLLAGSTQPGFRRDIVVIGASAGGTDALVGLLRQFPSDIAASFFVVTHMMPNVNGHLVDAINATGPLIAKQPEDGEEIKPGMVYAAPSDRHLLVKQGCVRITRGPRENRWRPAIDPLFRSAAVAYGRRVIGVILTGMLDDGTAGLIAIKRCGGIAIVQDPEEAAFPDMPRNALANVNVDHRLLVADMGAAIQSLLVEHVPANGEPPRDLQMEVRISESGYSDPAITSELGELTALSCPECGGPLWQQQAANMARYRCRVGHAYTGQSLLSAEDEAIEASIWAAVRLLEQRANILKGMADKDRSDNRLRMVEHHERLARESREHAEVLRKLLVTAME